MKTTLDIDDRLLVQAKVLAAREHTTLTKLIEQGLRLRLRPGSAGQVKIDLPVSKAGGGLAPGIDPLSNKSLLQEEHEDS